MTSEFILYLVIGRLLIYLGMKFPLLSESKFEFIKRLVSCGECFGVWLYTLLSALMGVALFKTIFYVPFVSELVTGGISAIFMNLIVLGWREKFTVIEIE